MGAGIYYESIERQRQLDAFFLRNYTYETVAAADSFFYMKVGLIQILVRFKAKSIFQYEYIKQSNLASQQPETIHIKLP